MSARGFDVRIFMCMHPSCTERAEGLPDGGGKAKGLPEGWVQVLANSYAGGSGKITSAYRTVCIRHYCSVAHLPSELLPEEGA